MPEDWSQYQDDVATFFRGLNFSAETNKRVKGVRTKHDIDVMVKSMHLGIEITWIIECKLWKTPINKVHVLALRQIVQDLGADRGILLSESGFQSGANEAATLTNVRLTSLDDLRKAAHKELSHIRLGRYFQRIERYKLRYWDIPKSTRIDAGLRPDYNEAQLSAINKIDYCAAILSHVMIGQFPVRMDHMLNYAFPDLKRDFASLDEAGLFVEHELDEVEVRLDSVAKSYF